MRRAAITAMLTGLVVFAACCSPAQRDRVLRFFFDVPATEAAASSLSGAREAARIQWVNRASFVSRHPPFEQRQCKSCHDAPNPALLRDDVRSVCGTCHADVLAARPMLHGPFASGACGRCHEPHVAMLPNLLRERDPQLCQSCHAMAQAKRCTGQQLLGAAARCLACHEPHAADDANLLRPRNVWEHLIRDRESDAHGNGRR